MTEDDRPPLLVTPSSTRSLRIAVVVPFLDEQEHLPRLLRSFDGQLRRPDRLLLVDDGSLDASADIAESYCASRPWAAALRRERRSRSRDRLAEAPEYQAFQWAVAHVRDHDVVGKLDADLELPPRFLEAIEAALLDHPRLGIVGTYLSVLEPDGKLRRERHPAYHVRGATKFYRRECYAAIEPVPTILGWDTIDEVTARWRGWGTRSIAVPEGDPLHLRPTGTVDGVLRAYSRWGACAYAAGYHPAWLALGAARRMTEAPRVVGGLAYLGGWANAAMRRTPRADPEVRRFLRREQLARLGGAGALAGGRSPE